LENVMRVLFIRHAAAEDRASSNGSDLDRRLTDEGREDARRMFKALASLYPEPNRVISSNAVRARETAEIFCSCFGRSKHATSSLLNPGSGFKEFRRLISELSGSPELIVLVGHEPDFSSILGHIVADSGLRIDVKKASCIEVEINGLCKGELKLMLTPKAVAKLAK
jgi:phosphohistidine phosphatase